MTTVVPLRRIVALALAAGLLTAAASAAIAGARPAAADPPDTASFVSTTIHDLQDYWARTMSDVYGRRYRAVPDDRLIPYTADSPPPACGGRGTTPYEEVAGNAFYCFEGDFVAWDAEQLLPRLSRRYGDLAVALVLAHEWGHVVQARTDSTIGATVYLETQADCFAGAWARHVEAGDDAALTFGAADLDTALGGYLEFRDPPGIDPSQDGAHGNGFDRVSAFQDGYERGPRRCAGYEDRPPDITEAGFTSFQDYSNGGDVSLDETLELVPADLDDYWSQALRGSSPVERLVARGSGESVCSGSSDGGVLIDRVEYCSRDHTVAYDRAALTRVYDSTGDFGAGMVLAAEWSVAAGRALGAPTQGAEGRLVADCLTGSWAGDVARGARVEGQAPRGSGNGTGGGSQLSLSPGDLDEAVATFVALGGRGEGRGSAFSRVEAFRKGFFDGVDACTNTSV
jgi:predicted metalloprotease